MTTPSKATATFWDHATLWADDYSLAGHTTDGGKVRGITRLRYAECDHYDCQPVVVISPEDRRQVERFCDVEESITRDPTSRHLTRTERVQAALREFATPTPPPIDEPQGLGAVVEAINDNRFVRVGDAGWVHEDDCSGEQPCDWEDIAVVRLLSEGVTP